MRRVRIVHDIQDVVGKALRGKASFEFFLTSLRPCLYRIFFRTADFDRDVKYAS